MNDTISDQVFSSFEKLEKIVKNAKTQGKDLTVKFVRFEKLYVEDDDKNDTSFTP